MAVGIFKFILFAGIFGFCVADPLFSGLTDTAGNLISNVSSSANNVANQLASTGSDIVSNILPSCILGVGNVSFILFNRDYPDGITISCNDTNLPLRNKYVAFLVHGFISEANNTNYFNLTRQWLKDDDINIISVDWKEGACTEGIPIIQLLGYPDAMGNTRDVGELVANCTIELVNNYGVNVTEVILVGHSLGAHVCGFAGKCLQERGYGRYGQIQGLDPAGPGFENRPPSERLDSTDADFVEAIHTSKLLGIQSNIAQVDIWVNGGGPQRNCITPTCSHSDAVIYFTESLVPNCTFIATQWTQGTRETYDVSSCAPNNCTILGIPAAFLPARGSFLSETNSTAPYCLNYDDISS